MGSSSSRPSPDRSLQPVAPESLDDRDNHPLQPSNPSPPSDPVAYSRSQKILDGALAGTSAGFLSGFWARRGLKLGKWESMGSAVVVGLVIGQMWAEMSPQARLVQRARAEQAQKDAERRVRI